MKRILLFLVTCACILCSCGTDVIIEDTEGLEPYVEKETYTDFKHLTRIELRNGTAFVRPYMLPGYQIAEKGDSASAKGNGLSLNLHLVNGTEKSAGNILEETYKEILYDLESNKAVENTNVCNVIEGDGYWIQEVDYEIKSGNNVYPCAVFIKLDQLADQYYLNTVLTMDNSTADDQTAELLSELLEAYGIKLTVSE